MEIFSSDFLAFRIKFRGNFKFHGPPHSSLHHLTAFNESDSMIICRCLILSLDEVIFIARTIAKISAELISIFGIGLESRAMNTPDSDRRTPPAAAWDRLGSYDASTFHFRMFFGGGDQMIRSVDDALCVRLARP